MRVRLPFAAVILAVVAWPFAVWAEARHAAMVIDANTGQVLHAQAADEARFPASLTKMMTLYMAFELIEAGRLSYQSRIKISQEAASAAPSKLDLDPGEEIALIDAIKALVTKSANDIAIAVAEHIGGSEPNFARLMTAKARQIGMKSTTFRNASGLPDPGQVTTARDMLTLALRLQDDFPRHYPLFATRSFQYNGGTHRNHNTLLGSYAGTDGIKTGYTRASGFNLVSSVRRDGRHVVAAVFGGASAASRNALMRALLSRALAKASTEKTRKPILVARPRPVHRPAAAVATAPPRPEPRKIAAVATAPAAAPSVPTAPPEAVADATAAAPRAQIEIARVRRVMVAPRPRKARAADDATGTEEPPAEAGSVRTPPPPAAAPAMVREATAAEPPPIRPPAAAVAPPQRSATPPAGIGRPPSTLQAQALAIPSGAPEGPLAVAAAGAHPSAYRLQGPAAPAPASNGPFHIQVGAYGTAGEAERQLATVKGRAAALLSARPTVALPVQKGPRHLYRARFAGFDATGAASACLELRRLGVDCFVMRGE